MFKRPKEWAAWLEKHHAKAPGIWLRFAKKASDLQSISYAEALIRAGRMHPAGLAAVEHAKQSGRWDAAYDSPSRATVPADLQAALDKHPKAEAFFSTLTSRNRYAILFRVQTTKKPETRRKWIERFIGMLERRETLYF